MARKAGAGRDFPFSPELFCLAEAEPLPRFRLSRPNLAGVDANAGRECHAQ
jgi:hypothetical protein